jgi:hypothetical protein
MPTPPRVHHLLPLPVLAEQLAPTYGAANNREPHEVVDEVRDGLNSARRVAPIVEATWKELGVQRPRLKEDELVERLAKAMSNRKGLGPRPTAAPANVREKMMAVLAFIDVNVGRASDAARAALETPQGQKMLDASVRATGAWLAGRIITASKPKGEVD